MFSSFRSLFSASARSRGRTYLLLGLVSCVLCTDQIVFAQACDPVPSGIVSWWDGASTHDSIGGNHGTLVGNTTFGMGKVGAAFVQDGKGDGMFLGNPLSLQLQNFTIEAWVKRANPFIAGVDLSNSWILGYGSGGFAFGMNDNGTLFLTHVNVDNVTTDLGTRVADVNYHHLAVTKAGQLVIFYKDGVAIQTNVYNATFSFSTPISIGMAWGLLGDAPTASFLGQIDELAVFNRDLSAAEIQAIYNAQSAGKCATISIPQIINPPQSQVVIASRNATFTVGATGGNLSYQWRFNSNLIDGATGVSLQLINVQPSNAGPYSVVVSNTAGTAISGDATLTVNPLPPCAQTPSGLVGWWRGEGNTLDDGGGNSGVLAGDTQFGQGSTGQGFVFDGDLDGVKLGNPPLLQLQDLTIECWIARSSSTAVSAGNPGAFLFGYGTGGYGLQILPDGKLTFTKVNVDNVATSLGVVTDTNWHHVAVTKSGTTVTFYVDGTAYTAPPYPTTFTFGTQVGIGAEGDNLIASFMGTIDEVSVYNRALSASEIQGIANASFAGKCANLGPVILRQPQDAVVRAGTNATLFANVQGTAPVTFQWYFNGIKVPGATYSQLTLINVAPTNAGAYYLAVTNGAGWAISSNAVLKVEVVRALGNNLPLTNSPTIYGGSINLSLVNNYPGGYIFYTLDGSTPSFASAQYSAPIVLKTNFLLRALGYSPDFSQSGEMDPPIQIIVLPIYTLTVNTPGGGSVGVNPSAATYLSNTTVTVTATPSAGWTFLQWLGDVSGTNRVATFNMTGNKSLQAIFGTTLSTTTPGGGSIVMNPPGGKYPYNTAVLLSAIPQAGSYFGIWGNAGSGTTNPLRFVVTSQNPTVSALFQSVGAGQVALSVIPVGSGQVSVSPQGNVFNANQNVTITATPATNQTFLGWSGDATGSQNPLQLGLDQSKVVYANFSQKASLRIPAIYGGLRPDGFHLSLSGNLGAVYQLESSTDTINWVTNALLTNSFGVTDFIDSSGTNQPESFYRARQMP